MFSVRTSVTLAVLAALLLGFILLFERGTPSSGLVERNKENPLPGLTREHLRKIEVQREGALTVLSRDAAEQDDDAPWRVEAPYRADADHEAVEALLTDLESMTSRRRITGISAEDRNSFGLARPRFRVWLTTGGTRTLLVVGNQSPRADGVYVEGSVPGVAFIVDKRIVETLSRPVADYHTKELLPDLHPDQVASVSIRDADGQRDLERDGNLFRLKIPQAGLASGSRVSALLQTLDALRASHFVKQQPTPQELVDHGLAEPSLTLVLGRKPAAAPNGAKAVPAPFELKIGKPCSEYPAERYATTGGALMCVADTEIAKLRPSLSELRESRLFPFDSDAAITSVQLERGGQQLKLDKTESGWSYEVKRGDQTVLKGAARAQAVTDWFEALRATKATGYRSGELAAMGGEPIRLQVTQSSTGGVAAGAPYVVQLGWGAAASELVAHRRDEPDLAMYPAAAAELLVSSAARLRSLEVAKLADTALRDIEIRRSGQIERLSRSADGNAWSITAPIHAPVDPRRMQALTRALAALEAVRFVADAPGPGYGLDAPESQLTVEYESSGKDAPRQRFGLRVGAASEGGRFAQLEGQSGVFVLAQDVAELLLEPLLSRTGLSVPLEQMESLSLQRAGRTTVQIKKPGEDAPASSANADASAVRELFETLATLRASRVTNYGPALPAEGFARPSARVTVALAPQSGQAVSSYTLEFGASVPDGRYVRRTDWPVRFVVPAASADVVSAFGSRPTPRR